MLLNINYDLPSSLTLLPQEKGAKTLVLSPFGRGNKGEGGFKNSYPNSATPIFPYLRLIINFLFVESVAQVSNDCRYSNS